jgi:hypothetical protein
MRLPPSGDSRAEGELYITNAARKRGRKGPRAARAGTVIGAGEDPAVEHTRMGPLAFCFGFDQRPKPSHNR